MERLEFYQNAIKDVDAQLRALLVSRMELSYKIAREKSAQGMLMWDSRTEASLLDTMCAELPRAQANAMREIWMLILREERKQYFLNSSRDAHL